MHDVTSDKTIVGIGANSGITGGGLNIGLPVDDASPRRRPNAVHNVIIRNLIFSGANDDSINVQMFSHHIWIDHNDLAQGFDGLVDIKRGSSYVTVSWNHIHDHDKNMLLGHDDGNGAQDIGRLKVTYHHNWFDGTAAAQPAGPLRRAGARLQQLLPPQHRRRRRVPANAGLLVEGNYFENVESR